MTIVKSCNQRSLHLFDGNKKHIHFIINGQYTFLFKSKDSNKCKFYVHDEERKQGLKIEFTKKSVIKREEKKKAIYIQRLKSQKN
jgi:hypothetical protein